MMKVVCEVDDLTAGLKSDAVEATAELLEAALNEQAAPRPHDEVPETPEAGLEPLLPSEGNSLLFCKSRFGCEKSDFSGSAAGSAGVAAATSAEAVTAGVSARSLCFWASNAAGEDISAGFVKRRSGVDPWTLVFFFHFNHL